MDFQRMKDICSAAVSAQPDYSHLSNRLLIYVALYAFVETTSTDLSEIIYTVWLFIDGCGLSAAIFATTLIQIMQLFDTISPAKFSRIISMFGVNRRMSNSVALVGLVVGCSLISNDYTDIGVATIVLAFIERWHLTAFSRYINAYVASVYGKMKELERVPIKKVA